MRYSLLLLVFCSIWRGASAEDSSALELEPISDDDWDGSLAKRGGFKYSKVHLQEYEHFVWGSPAGANQTVYVNMTMSTKDDELIISMERFASQLKSVNCTEEYMAMTFTSNTTYHHAISSWEWVNANENRTFIMIANHAGCGKDRSRSPWLVSNVYYDPVRLRVELNSTLKTWEETAHTYALDFGHYAPPAPASLNGSLAKRWKFDKSFPLDLNHQLPPQLVAGINTGGFNLGVSCPNCGTTGQIVLAGHVEVKFFGGLKTFTISATPQGVGAALNLDVKVGGTLPVGGFSQSINLATLDLGGFSIPGILTLGPTFNIDAGFGVSSLTGSATFSAGVSASIPDNSIAEVDLTGKKSSQVSGWVPTFTTKPLSVDAQIAVGMDVFTKLSVAASVLVLGNGFSVSLGLKVPDVTLKAVATVKSEGGVCEGSTKTIGVALQAGIGALLELQGFTQVLGNKNMFLNMDLFNHAAFFDFQPVCLAFGPEAVAAATQVKAIEAPTPTPSPVAEVPAVAVTSPPTTVAPVVAAPSVTVSVIPINTTVAYNEIGPGSEFNSTNSFKTVTISGGAMATGTAKIAGSEGWNSTVEKREGLEMEQEGKAKRDGAAKKDGKVKREGKVRVKIGVPVSVVEDLEETTHVGRHRRSGHLHGR